MENALVVYRKGNSSLNYIEDGKDFVVQMDYSCSLRYENKLYDEIPDVVFILTSENNSSWISREQTAAWDKAVDFGVPVFVLYQRKGTDEFFVYLANKSAPGRSNERCCQVTDFVLQRQFIKKVGSRLARQEDAECLGLFTPDPWKGFEFLEPSVDEEILLLLI